MRWSASLLYPYLLIEIVLIYMSRPSHDQEPTRGPHSFHHRHCDRNCCCFLLNACLSAGFAAEQTVGLRAVDDQKAVTMIHPAPQIFISQRPRANSNKPEPRSTRFAHRDIIKPMSRPSGRRSLFAPVRLFSQNAQTKNTPAPEDGRSPYLYRSVMPLQG